VQPHSLTYEGRELYKAIHKARLKKEIRLINSLGLPPKGRWGDFGCSDGFILKKFRKVERFSGWELWGFDFSDELLKLAKVDGAGIRFERFDLNVIDIRFKEYFDMATCFETLEHVSDYRSAFRNLFVSLKVNGKLLISVPNETGLAGLVKFYGRKLKWKGPYGDFFGNSSERRYVLTLLSGGEIESFRKPARPSGWGPHLGFDYRNLEKYIRDGYMLGGRLVLERKLNSFTGFNKLYLFQKSNGEG
jgi:SAM-dependent methyltransferase